MAQSRYTSIPPIPFSGIDAAVSQLLAALKENVELLTGVRGEPGNVSAALNRASLSVAPPPAQAMTRVSARGAGVTVSGANVPILDDYAQLLSDVQQLANDVAALRATVDTLVQQLRG